jgi:hypothetical protein
MEAIRNMADLPEPPYVAYRLEGQGDDGMRVELFRERDYVWLHFEPGSASSTWYIVHRRRDFANGIVDEERNAFYSDRSFFDPTWYGAYHALHDGMLFGIVRGQPKQEAILTPAPSPSSGLLTIGSTHSTPGIYQISNAGPTAPVDASPLPAGNGKIEPAPRASESSATYDLPLIAVVEAMGSSVYDVRDAGPAPCGNGDPGRALQLTARRDAETHQLTYAVVDTVAQRFCTLRFTAPGEMHAGGATSPTDTIEQHYGVVDGFWVQTDGIVTVTVPLLPFGSIQLGPGQYHWRYHFVAMAFPESIPDGAFGVSLPLLSR